MTLLVKVSYLQWPSWGHECPANCPPWRHSPKLSLYICNLHPSLCLECLPITNFLILQLHSHTPSVILFTSATHKLQLLHNVIKTNISRYKAHIIHHTVKCDILCKEDNTIISWTLFSEKKSCGNTVVAIWYWRFTCAIHKRCYCESVSHNLAKKNPARQHMYRFRKLRVLPFPLKVNTNNK